jgi:hypothetical protein
MEIITYRLLSVIALQDFSHFFWVISAGYLPKTLYYQSPAVKRETVITFPIILKNIDNKKCLCEKFENHKLTELALFPKKY